MLMNAFGICITVTKKQPHVITLKEVLSVVATVVMKEMALKVPVKVSLPFEFMQIQYNIYVLRLSILCRC